MALSSGVEDALKEHLQEFIEWMSTGWQMSDKDLEDSSIEGLPESPEKAYQMGYNAACEAVDSAYQLYADELVE